MKKYTLIVLGIFLVLIITGLTGFVRSEMLTSSANVSYDSNILEQFKNSSEVNIFFRLNNVSEATNLLSSFSEGEIKNIVRYNITDEIALTITEKGFNKLINDSRINVVYYNSVGYATNLPSCEDGNCSNEENCSEVSCFSNAGVKYDKGIVSKFIYGDRVYVIVTLKDNSGVIFSGTKEERHKQWEIQNELYKNKVNNVLNNLSEKDIIIYGNSSIGFSGLVSKDGFEKLKNMSDIEAIELQSWGKGLVSSPFFFKWGIYLILGCVLILTVLLLIKLKKKRNVKKN